MNRLITAAVLLTASFAATAEDRGAYSLHYDPTGNEHTQVAIFYVQLPDGHTPVEEDRAPANRKACQSVARLLNNLQAIAKPEARPDPWWCEAE